MSFDVIPNNKVVIVQLNIVPGGVGDGGWLTRAKDGKSEHLYCECVIVDGEFAKRKVREWYTVAGTTPEHAEAGKSSRGTFRAMIESARGIRPDDTSDAAQKARSVSGYQDLDKLRFVARIGVRPPHDGYAAQNTIKEIITPRASGVEEARTDRSRPVGQACDQRRSAGTAVSTTCRRNCAAAMGAIRKEFGKVGWVSCRKKKTNGRPKRPPQRSPAPARSL